MFDLQGLQAELLVVFCLDVVGSLVFLALLSLLNQSISQGIFLLLRAN